MKIIFILYFLWLLTPSYAQDTLKLNADKFITCKIFDLKTDIKSTNDLGYMVLVNNISDKPLNFWNIQGMNGNSEVYACINKDSCVFDSCFTMNDYDIPEEGIVIKKCNPNDPFYYVGNIPLSCFFKQRGLFKFRYIIYLSKNNPGIQDYYSQWYYLDVSDDLLKK